MVVEALAAILGADIEANPDGPSPLNDEPEQAGRHGVDRPFDPPGSKLTVERLS